MNIAIRYRSSIPKIKLNGYKLLYSAIILALLIQIALNTEASEHNTKSCIIIGVDFPSRIKFGNLVQFEVFLLNRCAEKMQINLSGDSAFNILVNNDKGEELWRFFKEDDVVAAILLHKNLNPSEKYIYWAAWDTSEIKNNQQPNQQPLVLNVVGLVEYTLDNIEKRDFYVYKSPPKQLIISPK